MGTKFYNPRFLAAEYEVAEYIKRLVKSECQQIDPVYGNLQADQPQAVDNACKFPFSILRGLPGSGKTTTQRQIVESFSNAGMSGAIMCPSAKAAQRASAVVNDPNLPRLSNPPYFSTIHKGLCYTIRKQGFEHDHTNQLPLDYVIMDESSMLGLMLARSFFSAIDPDRTRVVLTGDPNQLPSVDPGNVFHDIIMSEVAPDTNLKKIFRQGKDSGIVKNASRIVAGENPTKIDPVTGEKFDDFFFIATRDKEETKKKVIQLATETIPEKRGLDPLLEIQTLSPGKKSQVGTKILNKELRSLLNKNARSNFWHGYSVGDKVINRVNKGNLDIVNGDLGIVVDCDSKTVTVDFQGVGEVELSSDDISDIDFSYSYTIHSSQGSEFPCVIMPVDYAHFMLLYRNLLYTGITRAKKLFIGVGNPDAFIKSVSRTVIDKRHTGLQCKLRSS